MLTFVEKVCENIVYTYCFYPKNCQFIFIGIFRTYLPIFIHILRNYQPSLKLSSLIRIKINDKANTVNKCLKNISNIYITYLFC